MKDELVRHPCVQRPGVLREPGMFGELECVQHGWETKNKITDSESSWYKGKAREATSADISEGQREVAQTVPRMEHGPFNAQKEASSPHIC